MIKGAWCSSPFPTQAVLDQLKVGVHWETEVQLRPPNPGHRVCQVFCSALPVAYAKSTPSADWEAFARCVLTAAYDATLAAGALLACLRQQRVSVYLTGLGGGAFGNRQQWILDAISTALANHSAAPIDVRLVHYMRPAGGVFEELERQVTQRATAASQGSPGGGPLGMH